MLRPAVSSVGVVASEGVGAETLEAVLRKLAVLPERTNFGGGTGGEAWGPAGSSAGVIETRPANKDTRCWDDRRRGRMTGEGGVRPTPDWEIGEAIDGNCRPGVIGREPGREAARE